MVTHDSTTPISRGGAPELTNFGGLTWATYAPRDMTTVIKYYMVIKLDEKKICHGRPCPCPRQKYL